MRKWNGWGDESTDFPANLGVKKFLIQELGESSALPEAGKDEVLASVPPSRLPSHPLVSLDPWQRVLHSRGQSLPDWLAMRAGTMAPFPDGVAEPTSAQEVRTLLEWAKQENISVIPMVEARQLPVISIRYQALDLF